jgi:tetratricopeptide (TPR) repeat protein
MSTRSARVIRSFKASLIVAGCLGLASCASPGQQPSAVTGSADVTAAISLVSSNWPATTEVLSTTRGDIYLSNLDSQIQVLEHRIATTQQIPARVSLAGLLYHRFQLLGRIADADRARSLLQQAMEQDLLGPGEMLGYARILSGLHEFDAAQDVIDAAATRGAKPADINQASDQVLASRRLPSPLALPLTDSAAPADYLAAVQQSAVLLEQGELFEASRLLQVAQDKYQDSSPFPLAWIHLQQGVAFLRYQQYEQARVFFAAAHERLPQYYLATEHLAETEALLGNWQQAAELYRQVSAQTGQPAFWHGLQLAEQELGDAAAALAAGQRADEDYRQLLAQYPLTFADHAVGYFIDTGREQKALELAELNFANRQDVYAHLALAEALAANGLQQQACEKVAALRRAGLSPPEIIFPGEDLAACRS